MHVFGTFWWWRERRCGWCGRDKKEEEERFKEFDFGSDDTDVPLPLTVASRICYHVLGLVHEIWTPIPRAMKDYIATPKPNGYQSLHTTVIPFLYESMFRLEVQNRTEEMNLIAERGIAAHYSGKVIVNGLVGHTVIDDRNLRGTYSG
ncbi:hypothetical protein L1987_44073 [Smallanthus sonchifolius]|uniref:Uncharacterized protein n=1 Tax=Smallanthus sonchifolius TaxID=185202 RepID=A0ACB9GNA6_9ASTR|nr:hypothetical protein L1987_44073 [Smallanthus sonchifolius]